MMKNLCGIFLLICICQHSFAEDYLSYYADINTAEYHFVHKNYDSAFYYYDKAFAAYDYVFVKDAIIAAQIAWKQNNPIKTNRYLIKGAGSGLKTCCLNHIPILKDYMDRYPLFYKIYDSMKLAFANKKYNIALEEEWHGRIAAIRLSEYRDQAEKIKMKRDNAKRIKELLAMNIYPGEKILGLSRMCEDFENTDGFICLANYDCVISELHDPLWEAVKRGALHPRSFAMLWEWEYIRSKHDRQLITRKVLNRMFKLSVDVRGIENEYVITNTTCDKKNQQFKLFGFLVEEEEEKLNQNRAAYFICPKAVDDKKEQLQISEGYKLLFSTY